MAHFSWCEGYDAEYEYSVTVTPSRIEWHLQFDEQWSDPPRDQVQSFEDFLATGSPSSFSDRYNDAICKEVLERMKAPGYRPADAPPASCPLSEIPPAEGPLKTSWDSQVGSATHSVHISAEEVSVGTAYPNPHAGGGGASATHEEFLRGANHRVIIDLFGEGTLREIIAHVKRAATHGEFVAKRRSMAQRKKFITDIPARTSIKTLRASPAIVDGFFNYGNCGRYETELRTATHRFFVGEQEDFVEDLRSGKRARFKVPGYCVSVVALDDRFFCVCWNNFFVVDVGGTILFETYSLKDDNGDRLVGDALRFDRTFLVRRTVLASVTWIGTPMPGSTLRFDPKKLAFTGRCDEE